jgi:hypothetical protein
MPGLAAAFSGFADDAFARAPALETWLARATRERSGSCGFERALLAEFPVDPDDDGTPAAPLCLLGARGRTPDGYCLCATPVHLRTDSGGLTLIDTREMPFSSEENRALASAIDGWLAADGWRLEASCPPHWYLSGAQTQRLTTTPLSEVQGRNVGGCLPGGDDAAAWLRRVNEIQMLLYSHPVNRDRAARGQPIVNSVWLWGGGRMPQQAPTAPFSTVYADDALSRGLATWTRAGCRPPPEDASSVVEALQPGQHLLVVLDACLQAACYGDFQRWSAALEGAERRWFAPLVKALGRGSLRSLVLVPCNGVRYRLRAGHRWRFWRSSSAFSDVFREDGQWP